MTCRSTSGVFADPGFRRLLLIRAARLLHDLGQAVHELRDVKRPCDVVHGAGPYQAHGLIDGPLPGDEEEGPRVAGPRQDFMKLFAAAPGAAGLIPAGGQIRRAAGRGRVEEQVQDDLPDRGGRPPGEGCRTGVNGPEQRLRPVWRLRVRTGACDP